MCIIKKKKNEAFQNESSINGRVYDCSDENVESKNNICNDNNWYENSRSHQDQS